MILTGPEIFRQYRNHKIRIVPFESTKLTTNSYDLTLGTSFIRYREGIIDPRKPNAYVAFDVGGEGLQMDQGDFILGHSMEVVGSNHYVPMIHGKSGIARLGLFVHVTADIIDIGFHGHITFQLHSTLPVLLYPGMTIAQVSFWKPRGQISLYGGKYQASKGPRPSESYKDFPQQSQSGQPKKRRLQPRRRSRPSLKQKK
jgi:dCTP deaminase